MGLIFSLKFDWMIGKRGRDGQSPPLRPYREWGLDSFVHVKKSSPSSFCGPTTAITTGWQRTHTNV